MLSTEQKFIRNRMAAGVVTAILALIAAWWAAPFIQLKVENVFGALAISSLIAILPMVIMIGKLASMRFFSTGIDGSNTESIDNNVKVLNNTHEQTLLFLVSSGVLSISLPNTHFAMLPLLSLVFLFGRVLFWSGYLKSPIARAYGFAVTFYTNVVVLIFAGFRIFLT